MSSLLPVPFFNMWFGNFFEPFYTNREASLKGITDIADLGFTSINFDSKPWEDFFARYRGEPASQYVEMQEFMIRETLKLGLQYDFLALYLCGDNLYPNIRSVPPVRGEDAILPDGTSMGTYKYWSPKAQKTMVDHVKGLMSLYGNGVSRHSDGRPVVMTMFEPIPKPSFDEEGRHRYLAWLEKRYAGDISRFNSRYGLMAPSFAGLNPSEYWLRPEELNWVGCALPTASDFTGRTPDFHRWIDNQSYLAHELDLYLGTMKRHWEEMGIYAEPNLHQWGYFFNPPTRRDWQTGQRALDVYRCAKHVDSAMFVAAPLNAENRADATALSVEGSILRGANEGKRFTAGLYLGRHINSDIYYVVPPAEAIATQIANGANGLFAYGYSGLDDGGVLFRMDPVFKNSIKAGTGWAKKVIPLLDAPRAKETAILFPAEMSLYEPLELDEEGRHRMDLLGWYRQFRDLGWHVDIIHPDQVAEGCLKDYRHLVIPVNPLYDLGDNAATEAAVRKFVEDGGVIFHGPSCELAKRTFGIREEEIPFDCLRFESEEIIPHGWSTLSYKNGELLGTYIKSGKGAIVRTKIGKGSIYSVGFEYGYSYCRSTMPIVPPEYGNREMHPVVLLEKTPIEELIGISPLLPMKPIKGVEFCLFGDHLVIVNHRSSPVEISSIKARESLHLVPSASGFLAAHSAVCLEI